MLSRSVLRCDVNPYELAKIKQDNNDRANSAQFTTLGSAQWQRS